MSDFAQNLKRIRDFLEGKTVEPDPRRESSHLEARFTGWLRMINLQLNPGGERSDAPAADLLVNGLADLSAGARAWLRTARDYPETVVCCILQGVWQMSNGRVGRAIRLDDFKRWLRMFRAILRLIRRTLRGGSIDVFSVEVRDLSDLIMYAARMAVLGPILAVLHTLDMVVHLMGDYLTRQIGKSRCAPLLELWAMIVRWLYSVPHGFAERARSWVFSALVDLKRRTHLFSKGMSLETDPKDETNRFSVPLDPDTLEYYIRLIDRILQATDILLTCPVPERVSSSDPRPEGRRDPRGPTGPGPEPRLPGTPGTGGGIAQPEEGGPRPTDPRTEPPGGPDYPGYYFGRDGGAPTVSLPEEPDGWQSYYEGLPQGDWVYLTTDNIQRLLAGEFGVDPERARDVARGGRCREELSDEARQTLEQLGISL